ncbi:hypothetical protein DMB92_05975 [Campylobacter sp. MIT 99-7217]|uniref:hypothetical protein n=1 Tax=Campylobacter sp. MIT 99-7217 TaxID=535091 RepID=UPI00115A491D|nr:hypothetical protein [Campylobacter sp. MIT 99-7217]TQR31925.1 hypothetical protein DMB92_05975 [Campylobacter sp. MIT 99-7217]
MKKTRNKFQINTASSAIAQLMQKKHFTPLKNQIFYKDFLHVMMSASHQRLISKIFIHNYTLMILTKSSSGAQELNHDDVKFNLKFLIKLYAQKNPLSPFSSVKEIKIFMDRNFSKTLSVKNNPQKNTFLELSNGTFKNPFENPNLAQKFEELRKAIKDAKKA